MLTGLIKKELLALRRDMHALAALFLMPLLFIVVMSLALKNVYDPPLRVLRYAVDVRDAGPAAQDLLRLWQQGHGQPQPLPADWQAQLRRGALAYVIVLESGLSHELAQLSNPREPFIRLLAEPGIDGNLFNALKAEAQAIAGQLKARGALQTLGETMAPQPNAQRLVLAERFTDPRAEGRTGGPRPTSVQQNVAAWLVFGMFFVIAAITNLFVEERRCGALARLKGLGVPDAALLASKALPYFGVNLLQAALMLMVGAWLMPLLGGDALAFDRVHWPALVLVVCAVSAAAVSLALMLSCLVRTHAQASAVWPVLNILMAAIGGIMVPTFVMPVAMQALARWSPMNWGLEGLLSVLLRGGGVAEAAPHAARLLAFAAVMLMLAWLLFKRTAK
ncbi:MAG: ABC transporter [Methylibium sp. NZG]|nr:MAG: ABC transporter [Methylibium sp. NZG]